MTAATVLIEELEARTGIRLGKTSEWPAEKTVIAITSGGDVPAWEVEIPVRDRADSPEMRPEGYRLFVDKNNVVWVTGKDPRGTLYGVGALLRHLDWDDGKATLRADLDIATAPSYPIRATNWDSARRPTPGMPGHQLSLISISASSFCSASTAWRTFPSTTIAPHR
jgi:hypothetical protein